MLRKIIENLPPNYPSWALKRALDESYLPSHSTEQVEWNKAVGRAAESKFKQFYIKDSNYIAAWNILNRVKKYINSQQTTHFNEGQIYAMEIIDNLQDALALEPNLEWPEPFIPVYKKRAFWTNQEVSNDENTLDYSLTRQAGDPRWFLHIDSYTCPYYFLLGTITHRKVQLEVREISLLEEDKKRLDSAYEYCVRGLNLIRGERYAPVYRGEVNIYHEPKRFHTMSSLEPPQSDFWHIPRNLSGKDYCPGFEGIRQGDKQFKTESLSYVTGGSRDGIKIHSSPNMKPWGRHKPDPVPYGYAEREWSNETEVFYVFSEPPVIHHPEHPSIQLDRCYVKINEIPGQNMYLGKKGPHHD